MSTADKQIVQLAPNDLANFEYISTRYDAKIQQGVTPEELLAPAFWAHHAMKLKPMDELRARAEDGTWVAYLIVLDASRTWARVQLLSVHRLTTADVAMSQANEGQVKAIKEAHKIAWRGPHKWSVVRITDDNVLHDGEQQKDLAHAWLDRWAREQASAPPPATVAA